MADGTDTLGRTVVADQPRAPAAQPKRPVARQMPKWETDARDQVRAAVRRFARPLADLIARDANEGDTRLLVTDSAGNTAGGALRCLAIWCWPAVTSDRRV
jgi:hypothetical protein